MSNSLLLLLGVVALACGGRGEKGHGLAENKLYFSLPLQPGKPTLAVVPVSCVLFNILCPPGFVAPSTGGGSAGPPPDLDTQRAAALQNGNAYRAQHSAPAQTVDPSLQAEAQAYAEHLASTSSFVHSNPNGAYGENLARLPSPGTLAQANTAWYGEKPLYCPAGGSVNLANGHFTQMVWKGSTAVGYGSAVGKDGYTYIVARYSPPGNVIGLESSNISC